MPTEVSYYRPEGPTSAVQDFLVKLDQKSLARALSQIDLLEGDELPEEIDHEVEGHRIRVFTSRSGRGRLRFVYLPHGDQTVLIGASEGKSSRLRRSLIHGLAPIIQEIDETVGNVPQDSLKSHREFVAEMTLSDPTLAAAYSRARENAQFAVSLIRLRKALGLTQETLAERTGLSEGRIASLERGRMPKLATMRRLVDALQARILIAPGRGVTIEAHTEPKRPSRARRAGSIAVSPALLTDGSPAA